MRGKPAEQFPLLFKKWKVTKLTFETDTEPYAKMYVMTDDIMR